MIPDILSKILNSLNQEKAIDPLIGEILVALTSKLGAASSTYWYVDQSRKCLILRLTCIGTQIFPADLPGAGSDVPTSFPLNQYRTTRRLLTEKQPFIQVLDPNDPDLNDHGEWLLSQGVKAVLQLPVLIEDRLVGWIPVHRTTDRCWTEQELSLAKDLAHQVALAIQIVQLADQAKHAAVLEERHRMSREIHDTLAQGFTGILIQLQAVDEFFGVDEARCRQHLEKIRELSKSSLAEARCSVKNLRPIALKSKGFIASVRELVHQGRDDGHIDLKVNGEWPHIAPDIEFELFRIISEALANAIRHADASIIEIVIEIGSRALTMKVCDNGKGFSPLTHQDNGVGLEIMRERANKIGADLTIESRQNNGTQVVITIKSLPSGGT